jgi:hypothetical protein
LNAYFTLSIVRDSVIIFQDVDGRTTLRSFTAEWEETISESSSSEPRSGSKRILPDSEGEDFANSARWKNFENQSQIACSMRKQIREVKSLDFGESSTAPNATS